ncbi:MAG: hypothetical protein NT083_04315 [Rhodocyclales bacterium]|nr:hypothetical protein [Rhodocyclales bacterium]
MKIANKTLIQLGALAALSFSSGILSAQPAQGQEGPRKPPPEAIEACKSLSAGQECSFSSPHGTVKGSCWAPEGKPLACKPKDAPNDGPRPTKQ